MVGSGPDILLVTWDGKSNSTNPPIRKLKTAEIFSSGTRFNDGKADSSGRFWAGNSPKIQISFLILEKSSIIDKPND